MTILTIAEFLEGCKDVILHSCFNPITSNIYLIRYPTAKFKYSLGRSKMIVTANMCIHTEMQRHLTRMLYLKYIFNYKGKRYL